MSAAVAIEVEWEAASSAMLTARTAAHMAALNHDRRGELWPGAEAIGLYGHLLGALAAIEIRRWGFASSTNAVFPQRIYLPDPTEPATAGKDT